MRKILPALLFFGMLKGCITVETKTPTPPIFVTATLPAGPVNISTLTPTPEGILPRPEDCTDKAILLEDVTVLDGTRMGTPASTPLTITLAGSTLDISLDLVAPAKDGSYTAVFELRNPLGETVPIGLGTNIWVKIIVGSGAYLAPPSVGYITSAPGGIPLIKTAVSCAFSLNDGYVSQLFGLINAARREANLPALTVNSQLTAAAQGHSQDMACNNFLGHVGSNGSNIGSRLFAAGYASRNFLEIIAISTPQYAMDSWQADPPHWDAVLSPHVTELGIGYAYTPQSDFGGYFTVDLGSR